MLKIKHAIFNLFVGMIDVEKLLRISRIHGQLIFVNLQTEPGIRILGKCM